MIISDIIKTGLIMIWSFGSGESLPDLKLLSKENLLFE